MKLYHCTVCGQKFENRNLMANHVRWTHKEKKFSDEGYANIKKTAFKQVNKRKSELRGIGITVFRPCPKCKLIFRVDGSSKRMSRMKRFCSQKCANSHGPDSYTPEVREKLRKSAKANISWNKQSGCIRENLRRSSKVERSLAEALGPDFSRHFLVRSERLSFDVDIVSRDGRVWIESDGPYHFGKVHKNHDFEKTRHRDEVEGEEALKRGVLLIRVNNFKYTVEEQALFVRESISSWDRIPKVVSLY